MTHDATIRQALDFLLETEIADGESLEQLQTFRKNLDKMTFVPIVTTAKRIPLSMTQNAVHARLTKLDSTADEKVADGFLAYEETVIDAVFFIQRAGRREAALAQPIIERARKATELLLGQTEMILASDNGEEWTARRLIAEIIQLRPTYPELVEILQLSPADFSKRIGSKRNRDG